MSQRNTDSVLLQITVDGEVQPAVIRWLTVPYSNTFKDLKYAIDACFGLTDSDIGPTNKIDGALKASPAFKVVLNDPFQRDRPECVDSVLTMILEGAEKHNDDDPPLVNFEDVNIEDVFRNWEYRKAAILYEYDEEYYHVIQKLADGPSNKDGEILCVGAKGFTTRKGWENRRSSSKVDLKAVQDRLSTVEKARLGENKPDGN